MDLETSTTERLRLAWEQILKQYFDKAENDAKEEGSGMCIFRMRKEARVGIYNCEYFYLGRESVTWDKYMSYFPEGKLIGEIYDPERMFVIAVNVPDAHGSQDTVGNIRIFEFDTRKEILPSKDQSEEETRL